MLAPESQTKQRIKEAVTVPCVCFGEKERKRSTQRAELHDSRQVIRHSSSVSDLQEHLPGLSSQTFVTPAKHRG